MIKPKIAVIRGTREAVIRFYENFEKFEVRFIAASFKPFSYKSQKRNFEFVNLLHYFPLGFDPAGIIKQYGNLSWIYIKDLEKNLKGCDVICISDTYYFTNLQAVNLARKLKIPVVTVIWTNIPNHITSWFPPYSFITRKVVSSTDLFILRNKKALEFTDSLNIPRRKVKVIYKGVDLKKFKYKFRSKSGGVKILFTGNLSRAKGLDDLLAVFTKIRNTNPKIRLIIAGDGEMKPYVQKLHTQGLVDYRGFVPYENLPELYQEADIYCAPSKEQRILGIKVGAEYFSYALMEAQAVGLPIVATSIGGIPEEVGSKNLLVAPGDREELKGAMVKLIEDRSLRRSLSSKNRRRAERMFDAKKQANRTEQAILEIL